MSRSWQQKVSVYGQPQAEHIHITSTRSTTPCMRWRATKPAMARPSRGCSSGTLASKKFRYCLKNEGCSLKEVQPSFRVEWYKSCTPSFKQRQKERENSSKWYIEGYRQVLCANSFTSLAELSLHRAGKPALNYLVAEDRERVKGGEAACEALDVNSVFCYQPASSSCISMCFMLMYFFPPHWVPAT